MEYWTDSKTGGWMKDDYENDEFDLEKCLKIAILELNYMNSICKGFDLN